MELQIGLKGKQELTVAMEHTASTVGSGLLPVFATPWMVTLMEMSASEAVKDALEPGKTTVGIRLDIQHTAATPIGLKVWAEAELVEIDRAKLTFRVQAYDECGPIGGGIHERFIVEEKKFMEKAGARRP